MTLQAANEIIRQYEKYLDSGCTCFMGHPPCGYCVDCPTREEYLQALEVIREDSE